MSQTFARLTYHIVFSTKHREPLIGREVLPRLCSYMGGIVREEGGTLIRAGGMADHVHLLCGCSQTVAPADFVRVVKANSSKWMNERRLCDGRFAWQAGYGIFAVSHSLVPRACAYIENQERHHRRTGFQAELLALLAKHELAHDPRYIWE